MELLRSSSHSGFRLFTGERTAKTGENRQIEKNRRERTCVTDIIVNASVEEELSGVNVSSDFYDALDSEVKDLLADAKQRAQDNDRKTVQARDL